MKRLLLIPDAPAPGDAAPPASAAVVAAAKTERELELERELEVTKAEKANLASKAKKLETDVAHLQDENGKLRHPVVNQPAKEKRSWMGFSSE
jgi:predicted  nucleic acid-binding Zn-ribbon protein